MKKSFSHPRYYSFILVNGTLPLRFIWYKFISRFVIFLCLLTMCGLSKMTRCYFCFWDVSKGFPMTKPHIFIGRIAISGDCCSSCSQTRGLALWRVFLLSGISCCVSSYVCFLAETCCPGFHAVSLWERVPGAGAHRCGRVWGSLQMCEEAGWLLVCHKTISTTPGGLCQWVSQQHVISLPWTQKCDYISVRIKYSPCCNVFSDSWPSRKCMRMLYLATTHTLFVIIRHGQRMITWSFKMNIVMVGSSV